MKVSMLKSILKRKKKEKELAENIQFLTDSVWKEISSNNLILINKVEDTCVFIINDNSHNLLRRHFSDTLITLKNLYLNYEYCGKLLETHIINNMQLKKI